MKSKACTIALAVITSLVALTGCQTSVRPMQPLREVEYFEPVEEPRHETATSTPASEPAPATTAAATSPAPVEDQLRPGDRIVAIGGKPVGGAIEVTDEMIRSAAVDSKEVLTIERGGQRLDVTVTRVPPAVVSAATTSAPATAAVASAPATQKGIRRTRVVDPNQTVRYAYRTNYEYLFNKTVALLEDTGHVIDRQDFRLGVIVTKPTFSPHLIEPWKGDQTGFNAALENTMHNQRRSIRVTISRAQNPAFYEVGVQVLVERGSNPTEEIGGPIFTEGSGFGRNQASLRSDFAAPGTAGPRWRVIGHDPALESKILDKLFKSL